MKSYEVIHSIVARHRQYDAAMLLTLNLAASITAGSQQDEAQSMARLADSICTLCDAVRDILELKGNPQSINELLKRRMH